MLASLRHDTFVGGDDQGYQINAMRAGQHVFYESLMTGHIDEAYAHVTQIQIRESQIDGDAASLFLREAIRIDACQRPHQRRFSMIDVPGRANYD